MAHGDSVSVSVVIPARNAASTLQRAVDSVFETGVAGIQACIVDDASTDATAEVIRSLVARYGASVLFVRQPEPVGVSVARNVGVAATTGNIIAFLDADDYYFPHRFDAALDILEKNQSVEGVYESAEMVYQSAAARERWFSGVFAGAFGIERELEGLPLLAHLLTGKPWPTSAFTCRRRFFKTAGGFHPRLRIAEDCHLWFKMAASGRIVAGELQKPVAAYVRHEGNTYSPKLEHRVSMVDSMTLAYRWVCKNSAASATAFADGVCRYATQALIVCRESGRHDLARSISVLVLRRCMRPVLADPHLLRQLVWLGLESVFPVGLARNIKQFPRS